MRFLAVSLALAAAANAHTALWHPGMWCFGGSDPNVDDQNTNLAVNPLYNLTFSDFWFQKGRGCLNAPPKPGKFLELPAGGTLTGELAHNRGQTTWSYNGQYTSDWPDGQNHTEPWVGPGTGPGEHCIQDDGAMHTESQATAAGTALAISYVSSIDQVTLQNLVVFTVAPNTPWKRIVQYPIPAALPACPPDGCICAWLWVPKGCGQPNVYMEGLRCKVTGATSTVPVAPAKAPVFCDGNPDACVKGAKQMIIWNQLPGVDNIVVPGGSSPGYNQVCGFSPGAQNDIFAPPSSSSTLVTSTKTTSSTSTKPTSQSTTTTSSATTSSSAPASTVYLYACTQTNWSGTCQNLAVQTSSCKSFQNTAFWHSIRSAGPDRGTCTFFSDAACTTKVGSSFSNPGKSSFGSQNAQAGSVSCTL